MRPLRTLPLKKTGIFFAPLVIESNGVTGIHSSNPSEEASFRRMGWGEMVCRWDEKAGILSAIRGLNERPLRPDFIGPPQIPRQGVKPALLVVAEDHAPVGVSPARWRSS